MTTITYILFLDLLQDGSSSSKKNKKSNLSDALVDAAVAFVQLCRSSHVTSESPKRTTTSTGISSKLSPMKYVQLRCSSLEDLKTLKSLYKENVISENKFADEKERVLSTLKSLQ